MTFFDRWFRRKPAPKLVHLDEERVIVSMQCSRDLTGKLRAHVELDPGYVELVKSAAVTQGMSPQETVRLVLLQKATEQPILGEEWVINAIVDAVTRALGAEKAQR